MEKIFGEVDAVEAGETGEAKEAEAIAYSHAEQKTNMP